MCYCLLFLLQDELLFLFVGTIIAWFVLMLKLLFCCSMVLCTHTKKKEARKKVKGENEGGNWDERLYLYEKDTRELNELNTF